MKTKIGIFIITIGTLFSFWVCYLAFMMSIEKGNSTHESLLLSTCVFVIVEFFIIAIYNIEKIERNL